MRVEVYRVSVRIRHAAFLNEEIIEITSTVPLNMFVQVTELEFVIPGPRPTLQNSLTTLITRHVQLVYQIVQRQSTPQQYHQLNSGNYETCTACLPNCTETEYTTAISSAKFR